MRTQPTLAKQLTPGDGELELVVLGEDGVAHRHPLPATGAVTIGRSGRCDVFIDEPSISRRHAVLHLGPPLTLEDLGSANGTRIGAAALAPRAAVRIAPNQPIDLGSILIVVQPRPRSGGSRLVWSADYFALRVEEECARAAATRSSLVVLHLDAARSPPATLEGLLARLLGPGAVVGGAGAGTLDILLAAATLRDAEDAADRVIHGVAARGVAVRRGLGRYGVDGRDAVALIATARAVARAAHDDRDRQGALAGSVMDQLGRLAERVALGDINVLILGETGVGKELMAERIHRASPRAARPFLRLNCAALSEHLLESELFGHERGAFTGAVTTKPGLLETAEAGTVFLDEIGELPPGVQAKLLRVLDEGKLRRVGAVKPRAIDVRYLAATNRDLVADVAMGRFREDLYYRLNGISLSIPPLRERVGEIAGLAREFAAVAGRRSGRASVEIDPDALATLLAHAWPGNIRELRNVVERGVLLAGDGPILPAHLTIDRAAHRAADPAPPGPAAPLTIDALDQAAARLRRELEDLERRRISTALAECAGNQSRAAELLGMPRRTLVAKLKTLQIGRPHRRKPRLAPPA